ncbi:MAG: class I SAM-dependent methyltransferase [Alphaproteobacteria bacterium]|nr:class I SAM-dependent methyltransferase [Alphaproteobacteria bacterium]
MKSFLIRILDRTLVPLVAFVNMRTALGPSVIAELHWRSIADSADYAAARMASALTFKTREALWDFALSKAPREGLCAEFGVWNGASINHFARRLRGRAIFGFDSFEGLQEDWAGAGCPQGTFDRGGVLPQVESNVTLVKGWFDKTIPGFLAATPGPMAFVHIDCDTYPAASVALNLIAERIRPGTIIVFDEYFGYRGWRQGEHKAWQETVATRGFDYEYVGFCDQQVALIVR